MSDSKEDVVETHLRYAGNGAELYINQDASWSIGTSTKTLVPVHFGSFTAIDDDTFGFSAVCVEKTSTGFTLYVRSDADENTLVQVKVSATGEVDAASIELMSSAELYEAEDKLKTDLNDNGTYGSDAVCLLGGDTSLFMSASGAYAVGASADQAATLTVGSQPLTDKLLPSGWTITKVLATATGFEVFAQDPSGAVFDAQFSSHGELTGGSMLSAIDLAGKEKTLGVDLNGNGDLSAAAGWTSVLKTASLKTGVDTALADGHISYTEAVGLVQGLIDQHKSAGTTISASEVTDLQAIAARGDSIFAGGTSAASDYLSFVFSKMVDGSVANRFYTGGQLQATELGNLAPNAPVSLLEKLVDKWLLGGDLPAPKTGGDKANPAAQEANPTYAKATGSLFVDGVAINDVNQGSAGDCYLLANLLGVAAIKPEAIQAMVVDNGEINGSHTWGVRFFDGTGTANWVTVNDMLPVSESGKLQYAGNASKDASGELWVSLIEKAYAEVNTLEILFRMEATGLNSYLGIEGGRGDAMVQILGGPKVDAYIMGAPSGRTPQHPYVDKVVGWDPADKAAVTDLISTLSKAMNAGQAIYIGTKTDLKDSFGNTLLSHGHAQLGLDGDATNPNNTDLLVYNPWGLVDQPTPPGPTAQQFISPVRLDIADLVGQPGISFFVQDAVTGG